MTDPLRLPESRMDSFAAWCHGNMQNVQERAAAICEALARTSPNIDVHVAMLSAAQRIRSQPIPGAVEP